MSGILMLCISCNKIDAPGDPGDRSNDGTEQTLNVKDVPSGIVEKFNSLYPDVKPVKWKKEGNTFEAKFKYKGCKTDVVFDTKGNVIETETDISINDLPLSVSDAINNNYAGMTAEEAEKVVKDNGIFYEVELEGNGIEKEILFDSAGNLIEEETEDENDETDEAEDDDNDDGECDDYDENEVEINPDDLPQNVKDNLNSQFPGAEILEADKITHENGSVSFDVEIKTNGEVIEVMYNNEGKYLGQEFDDNDDDDENDDD